MVTLHEIAPTGGEPTTTLPYGPARDIAFGPHGAVIWDATPPSQHSGSAIAAAPLATSTSTPRGDGEFTGYSTSTATSPRPCWVGDRIYFISDHEGIGNVYSCLATGEDLRRHSDQTEYYARGLSGDGTRLVYFAGGDIYLSRPGCQRRRPGLEITLGSASTQRARKFVSAGRYLDAWAIHPKGHATR